MGEFEDKVILTGAIIHENEKNVGLLDSKGNKLIVKKQRIGFHD